HTQVSDADGAVADFHVADWILPAAHRLEEISHVTAALVELDGTFRQRCPKQFLVAGRDGAARHKNPAVRPDELNAVRRLLSFTHYIAIRHGAFVHDGHGHTVGIFAVDAVLGRGGEATRNHFLERLAIDLDRAAALSAIAP